MKLLVTGASGRLGRATADHLLKLVEPGAVILASRTPEQLADYAERGVDVRAADFARPDTLAAAFAGADRMLLISTDAIGQREPQHRAAVDAASAAGVEFVAYTSFPPVGAHSPLSAEHAATEELLRGSGLSWCVLRNFPYADNEVDAMRQAVAAGELVTNTDVGRTSFVARADCAAVAAAVLAGDGHAGHVYDVAGPQLLDATDRARVFSDVTGSPVSVRHVDDQTLAREVSDATGLPFPVALGILGTIGQATRAGVFAVDSDIVERLAGRPALTLRDVLAAAIA